MEENREARDVSVYGIDELSKIDIRERHILVSYIRNEGFGILQRIMEDSLKTLNQNLIKATGVDAIISAHAEVNGANKFYHTFIRMLQEETMLAGQEGSTVGTIENPERPAYMPDFEGQELL